MDGHSLPTEDSGRARIAVIVPEGLVIPGYPFSFCRWEGKLPRLGLADGVMLTGA